MNIPLIATINHRTIDLRTKALKVKIYRNGETEAVESPYVPYYLMENDEGDYDEKEIKAIESYYKKG